MPFLPSLEHEDKVPHAMAKFQNGTQRPIMLFHQALLRGESPFSVKERELMAAYVSGLNACQYCYGGAYGGRGAVWRAETIDNGSRCRFRSSGS